MYEHKDKMHLRKIRESDLTPLLALKQESWWGTHKTVIANQEDQQSWYKSLPNDCLYMMAEWLFPKCMFRYTIGVVGYTEIDHISQTCKISGSVFSEYRKEEVVKAGFSAGVDFAFEMLNMRRLESEVLECNLPSQSLQINHLGFKVEGRKRKAVYKCGKYYDSIILGLLREEWQSQPRVLAYGSTCNVNFDHDLSERMAQRSAERISRSEAIDGKF